MIFVRVENAEIFPIAKKRKRIQYIFNLKLKTFLWEFNGAGSERG